MADELVTSISLVRVRELIDEKDIGEKAGEAVDLLLGLVLAVAPLVVAPVVGRGPAPGSGRRLGNGWSSIPLWGND